jgi:hypothetical protein
MWRDEPLSVKRQRGILCAPYQRQETLALDPESP